jgi:hypothetical protein
LRRKSISKNIKKPSGKKTNLNELIQSQFEGIGMQGFLESAVATGGRAAGRSVTGGEVLGALAVCEVWRAPQIST